MSPNELRKLQTQIRQLPCSSLEMAVFLGTLNELIAEMNRDVERVRQIRALEEDGEFPIGFRGRLKDILSE